VAWPHKRVAIGLAAVLMRNVSQDDRTMTPDGEAAVTVPPQRRLGVRTMVIDFGPARGRIYTD
jgi:hypothetical protein